MRETLKTERLLLRPLKPEDAGPISLYAGDIKVARMLSRIPHPYPPGAAAAFVERALSGEVNIAAYAIELLSADRAGMVGVIELRDRGAAGERRLGYWLGAPAWGRGIATEAARAVLEEGFADPGLQIVTSDAFLDNVASRKVLEKCGFTFGDEFEQFCPARGEAVRAQRCALERVRWFDQKSAVLR